MVVKHIVEYSKTSSALCAVCKQNIPASTLRYGRSEEQQYSTPVSWHHWGCISLSIIGQLRTIAVTRIQGYTSLRPADRTKVLTAIVNGNIDPADKTKAAITPMPSQKKRKAEFEATKGASTSSSQSAAAPTQPLREIYDEEEEIQDTPPEEEPQDELYCILRTDVVGIQYYTGLVGPMEEVILVREPHNRYDSNAIQVKNISHIQVGHVPRNVAARLSPLLDRKVVTVEGIIHDGNLTSRPYKLGMSIKFYADASKRDQIEPMLKWATPGQRGFPERKSSSSQPNNVPGMPSASQARSSTYSGGASSGGVPLPPSQSQYGGAAATAAQQKIAEQRRAELERAAELKQILNNLEKVDDEGRRSTLLDAICSKEDVLKLPTHPNPPGIASGELKVDLLKHQSQALLWCMEKECPTLPAKETDPPVQFWQVRMNKGKKIYFNLATKTPTETAPVLGKGALCADSMGLGKTLTMIALVLATRTDKSPGFSQTTLIVAPLSVLSNWEKQVQDHCTDGALSIYTYYGAKRSATAQDLQRYDVVITTYQTVAGEHDGAANIHGGEQSPSKKKRKKDSTLFEVAWKRVILDEGHQIRNPKTKMAQAACGLHADRRWVLSGTPIINSPRDLGSMLTFLRICRPLDDEDMYKRMIIRPLAAGLPSGSELLTALMSHVCIRRTKEMQDSDGNSLVPLPPVEMIVVPVTLNEKDRVLYEEIEALSTKRVENFINAGRMSAVTSNVLSLLTRMRQIVLHPGLVPANYLEDLRGQADLSADGSAMPAIQINAEERARLQMVLAQRIEDCEECPVCFDLLNDPRITSCSHSFCLACITEVILRDPKCPMDRRLITTRDLIEPPPPTELTQAPLVREVDADEGLRSGSSAKIDQLIHLLRLTPGTEKSLVFSQFTSFLDKIAEQFDKEGIPYVRFDGQMSAKRRKECIERFSIPLTGDEPGPTARHSQPSNSIPTGTSGRRARKVKSYNFGDDNDFGDNDGDYVDEGHQDDDDFIDDDEDGSTFTSKKKGKGKAKAKAKPMSLPVDDLLIEENPQVMLISLKAGALGLNLTVANNVFLMDPWWQEGIESQAIDRCNRIGQKKPVHVYQLVAENTVESKVLDIQEKKKKLIQEAFSGIKRKETLREKKEARLQDLIALFGARAKA